MNDNLLCIPEKYKDITEMFNKQLYSESDISDDEKEDQANICYITGDTLQNDKIELLCKHKFNYLPLYCEIVRQKTITNALTNTKLKVNELQCPYCRRIQKEILPFSSNYKLVYGVNYPEEYTMKPNNCSYIFKSGIRKGKECRLGCYDMYCKNHIKYMNKVKNNIFRCSAILKTGANKGNRCKCKVSIEHGFCNRHKNN